MHVGARGRADAVPGAQGTHDDWPGCDCALPGVQAVQMVRPLLLVYEPVSQALHTTVAALPE